jgi:hypothetical protein
MNVWVECEGRKVRMSMWKLRGCRYEFLDRVFGPGSINVWVKRGTGGINIRVEYAGREDECPYGV